MMCWLRMRRVGRIVLTISLSAALMAGCGGQNGANGNRNGDGAGQGGNAADQSGTGGQLQQQAQTDHAQHGRQSGAGGRYGMQATDAGGGNGMRNEAGQAVMPIEAIDGKPYADAEKMAGLIGFRTVYADDNRKLMIGDHDPVLELTADSAEAVKEENPFRMNAPAVMRDGRMLVPADALQRLFGGEAVFTVSGEEVAIFPQPEQEDPMAEGGEDFGDDPDDPATAVGDAEAAWVGQDGAVPAIANASGLVSEAKRFMGVPYLFGSASYSKTKRFDCSSFTRYLFAKRGVTLPRTARAQAAKGVFVPRDKLRVGDLMYFYVPGRFKSNKKVGHVGIYMGNRKMIHSSPLPKDGVQITSIDKAYWKRTYLYAKRLP